MNPSYQEFKYPVIAARPWTSIFRSSTSPDAIDLISKMLTYIPDRRVTAIEVSEPTILLLMQ
jgi:hypothetical protein